MKTLILALFKDGTIVNLNKPDTIPDSEVAVFIRGEYDGRPKDNESWFYSVFDSSLNVIENSSFEWLGFTCTMSSKDSWLFPLEDWSSNHHQWRRIKTLVSDGSKSISINLRHSYHEGEAFRTLSKILSVAKEKGLAQAKEAFREFSKQEPGA